MFVLFLFMLLSIFWYILFFLLIIGHWPKPVAISIDTLVFFINLNITIDFSCVKICSTIHRMSVVSEFFNILRTHSSSVKICVYCLAYLENKICLLFVSTCCVSIFYCKTIILFLISL